MFSFWIILFSPNIITNIYAAHARHFCASISELKQNPIALLEKAEGEPIAIFQHDLPTASLVPAQIYEQLINQLEDYELKFLPSAKKEWDNLDNSVKTQFKNKLKKCLENPHIPANR